jgi:hypothetical protein
MTTPDQIREDILYLLAAVFCAALLWIGAVAVWGRR